VDPEACLTELRELAAAQVALDDSDALATTTDPAELGRIFAEASERASRMAELFQALDQWLKGGGFLPANWKRSESTKGELVAASEHALRMLDNIARRSTDQSSRAIAQGAADDLRKHLPS
jgi:hypothetical protein